MASSCYGVKRGRRGVCIQLGKCTVTVTVITGTIPGDSNTVRRQLYRLVKALEGVEPFRVLDDIMVSRQGLGANFSEVGPTPRLSGSGSPSQPCVRDGSTFKVERKVSRFSPPDSEISRWPSAVTRRRTRSQQRTEKDPAALPTELLRPLAK